MSTLGRKVIFGVLIASATAATTLTVREQALFAQPATEARARNSVMGIPFTDEQGTVIATLRVTVVNGEPHLQLLNSKGKVTWSTEPRLMPAR